MTKDEALKLALEALESFAPHNGVFWRNLHKEDAEIANVIASLRQAIEQAEKQKSKPVCWDGDEKCPNRQACCDAEECLYTTPQPQRTWVGLTPDEVFGISDQHLVEGFDPDIMAYTRAIEAKLKEKNT